MTGSLTDNLVKEPAFYYEQRKKDETFNEALLEEIRFHYDNNDLYHRFCENKGFNPYEYSGTIEDIPPVQVSVFKELGNQLNSVPDDNIKITLQSSATSGVPSSIPIDSITSKRQAKTMVRVLGDFIGNERKPFLVMDVDPSAGFRHILGARYAAVSGYLNFATEAGFFLKVGNDNTYYFDIDGIKAFIERIGSQSSIVFGFTYILYSEVLKPLNDAGISFELPKDSKIIHIGGWKKLESRKVSRDEFNLLAANVFGVGYQDVIDIYGFTEQMGLNYPDCPCGYKHTPLYSEVIVRDIVTKEPLDNGMEGLLEFVTPIPHSYPGNAVLTDDIGIVVDGDCEYHRGGKRFRVTGRLKKAEIRGCGDILSSKLKFAAQGEGNKASQGDKFRAYYIGIKATDQSITTKDKIKEIGDSLNSQISWLRIQPVDALIGLITKVSNKWKEETLNVAQTQGLKYLVSWCSGEHLTRMANDGLRGNRLYADMFLPADNYGVHSMRTTSRGLVCHWLAGNVQVLGMFVLIQCILTKNVNLIRVSNRDNGTFINLLRAFEDEEYTTPGGYTITGNDLLKCIAVVSFDHTDFDAGKQMSRIADVRVAWGGAEAVSTISAFPSKYDCVDIIMGPKLSFTVVSCDELTDEHKAKKLARKIAVDASVFDQTGCASTHNVFVEEEGRISPAEFAAFLSEGMSTVARQIPKDTMTVEEYASVHSVRGIYDFKGTAYGDPDSVWTVLYSDTSELSQPIYSRVVFVHPIASIDDALEFASEDIQTIGLAATGAKAAEFATKAAQKGVMRFPACGKMLNFESPWDGMFIMERLVKWNTLGGPLM